MVKKEVKLSVEQVVGFNNSWNCSNEECLSQFFFQVVGSTIVFSTTAVISGSIAGVGNTLYWVEEQGKCSD
jgi:hypothetical protein